MKNILSWMLLLLLFIHTGNDLESMVAEMTKIPGATIKVVTDEQQWVYSVHFQDNRMKKLFEMYPEVILIDATYKLNNRRMPLFVVLVIDGCGESEIASLWTVKSESRDAVSPMVAFFKDEHPNWINTKVIIGNKDFANRAVFSEMFPQAQLQICLYHVIKNFEREITTKMRNISEIERTQVPISDNKRYDLF